MMKAQVSSFMRLAALAGALAFALPAAAQTVLPPPTANGQADARQDQIEDLQRQLQRATSDNEALQMQLRDARAEVARLQGVVGELTAANAAAVQQSTPASGGAVVPQGGGPTPAPPPASAPAAAADPAAATAAYSRGRELLQRGNLAEAETVFADYLHNFPNGNPAQVSDALYWYGYVLLARNDYENARVTFVQYLTRYRNGARAADSQVRLGIALSRLGDTQRACTAFTNVPQRYPGSPAAVREQAANEARALHCPAT